MRRYSKYENVLNMLRRHVNQRRREGNLRLEGERELMIRFGTSRKTLAKAQETLIAENSPRGSLRRFARKGGMRMFPIFIV